MQLHFAVAALESAKLHMDEVAGRTDSWKVMHSRDEIIGLDIIYETL